MGAPPGKRQSPFVPVGWIVEGMAFAAHDPEDAPRLAGQSVRDLRWAFEAMFGKDVVARALASLPEPVRTAWADAMPMDWVPYTTVVAVHEAIAREAKTTMETMLERAVPMAVERAFTTVWRVLLRFTSDEALLTRTPLLYSKTRSKGSMTTKVTGVGRAVVEVRGWPGMPPRDVRALTLSIETLLRLAGREGVRVIAERTAHGARYEIRWRP
jgi:hypothetical protein